MSQPPPKKKSSLPPPCKFLPRAKKTGMIQDSLIPDLQEDWAEQWKGMPKFVCDNLTPWKSITINFQSRSDLEAFAELIGQKGVKMTTRSTWFPKAPMDHNAHLHYVDGAPGRHYYEWQKSSAKLPVDFPKTLPPDIEEKVLAYDSCMHLLE